MVWVRGNVREGKCLGRKSPPLVVSPYYTVAVSNGKRNVTVWRPSVCPSVCPVGLLTVTHQGQHATRPAYNLTQQ